MTVNTNNRIIYTAFVCALTQLDLALKNKIQPQLDDANEKILMDKSKIYMLDLIAEKCPKLDKIYKRNRDLIENAIAQDRRLDPPPFSNQLTAENPNTTDIEIHYPSDLNSSVTDSSGDSFISRVMESIKLLIGDKAVQDLAQKLITPDKSDV